jgi:hypothetical protein
VFGTQDNTVPAFLLDNAHCITTAAKVQSEAAGFTHTALSLILTKIAAERPVCIVAGTNDGYLENIADCSRFVVKHIYLTTLGVQYWNAFGRDLIAFENKKSIKGKKVIGVASKKAISLLLPLIWLVRTTRRRKTCRRMAPMFYQNRTAIHFSVCSTDAERSPSDEDCRHRVVLWKTVFIGSTGNYAQV